MPIAYRYQVLLVVTAALCSFNLSGCNGQRGLGGPLIPAKGMGNFALMTTTLPEAAKALGSAGYGQISVSQVGEHWISEAELSEVRSGEDPQYSLLFWGQSDSKPFEVHVSPIPEFLSQVAQSSAKLRGVRVNLSSWALAKTDRGLQMLDSREKVEQLYGFPDTWGRSSATIYYYKCGLLVRLQHPSKIQSGCSNAAWKAHSKKVQSLSDAPDASYVTGLYICPEFSLSGPGFSTPGQEKNIDTGGGFTIRKPRESDLRRGPDWY